jgi:hypothetical protein
MSPELAPFVSWLNAGDEVLILNPNKNKPALALASIGPFVIQQVHVNGTITII